MDQNFFLIVVCAIVVGAICKSRNINPAIPLILAGFVLELINPTLAQAVHPEVVLTLILAPLVFAAGLSSSAVDLRRVRRSVLSLAVVLVIITTLVVGVVTNALVAVVPLAAACALGAVLAPTDAVAASAVASKTNLPRRVLVVVEGESLANDGTALTILRVFLAAVVAGSVTFIEASGILVAAVVGGVVVGGVGGFGVSWLMRFSREPVVANAILLLTPFGLYELSEHIGGSGLLTVVIAGVWIAHATGTGPAYKARLQATSVWSLITFLLESIAFFLVGIEFVDIASKVDDPGPWTIAWIAILLTVLILVTRIVFMAGWFYLGPRLLPNSFSHQASHRNEFIAIGLLGVRGPVSVLAAFSIPLVLDDGSPFPGRELLLTLTFAVVVVSLLMSFAAAPIIRRLNLSTETEGEALQFARISVAKAALRCLDDLVTEADLDGEPYPEKLVLRVRSLAKRRIDGLQGTSATALASQDLAARQRKLQHAMLHAERLEVDRLRREHGAPGDIVKQLTHELDVREAALS